MDPKQKEKLAVLWVDALVRSHQDTVPEVIRRNFDVHQQAGTAIPTFRVSDRVAAIFINYDYPDRNALRFAVSLKRNNPSVTMIVLSVQHSEALAVWAFRSRMADYIVKPATAADLHRAVHLVSEAWRLRTGQTRRAVGSVFAALPSEAQEAQRPSRQSVLPAIYYVRQHYGEKVSLEAAAARCGLKPAQLTRLFHQTYGLTFRDYVVRYRLREAKRLLRNPTAMVSEVADIVGFNDVSYFSKMFKRHFGIQPSEHRGRIPPPRAEGVTSDGTTKMLRLPAVP